MRLGEKEWARLPAHLQALFVKLPNPGATEVVECFPETDGATSRTDTVSRGMFAGGLAGTIYPDTGNASRFFYCAKASRADRYSEAGNDHPTVKPESLIRYLIRLITPPGGLVLDPFLGSGTTAKAAYSLGFHCIGIDLEEKHCEIAAHRLNQGVLDFGGVA